MKSIIPQNKNRELTLLDLLTSTPFPQVAEVNLFPRVDLVEDDKGYYIHADIPGVSKEDISVEVDDGTIVISGKRTSKSESKENGVIRKEIFSGEFSRAFSLPEDADDKNISAETKDGVLDISIPKKEQKSETKKIEIK